MPLLDVSGLSALVEELVMGDTVRVTRRGVGRVLNEDTGELEDAPATLVYEGPGAVIGTGAQPIGRVVPSDLQDHIDDAKNAYRLLTPAHTPVPRRDDTLAVIAVHSKGDPSLLTRSWRIAESGQGQTLIAVRLSWCDEIQPKGAP
ncbi:DUF6093 family protein [Kitasatospora sp. NPDC087315]|uniref:DUF6093 family protein n=1 Tax=Kitasatospora sp. NPDC087315 TaxID=3364069 RepID=UPI003806F87B